MPVNKAFKGKMRFIYDNSYLIGVYKGIILNLILKLWFLAIYGSKKKALWIYIHVFKCSNLNIQCLIFNI